MSNPQMTLNQLRDKLNAIDAKYGDYPVTVWVQGNQPTFIDLRMVIGPMDIRSPAGTRGEVIIDANIRK
jgi:hypothetical protein